MRTAIWEAQVGGLIDFLRAGSKCVVFDLYEFETRFGRYRYSGGDIPIQINNFVGNSDPFILGLKLSRSEVENTIGIQTTTQNITMERSDITNDIVYQLLNQKWDNSRFTLYRLFLTLDNMIPVGAYRMWRGVLQDYAINYVSPTLTFVTDQFLLDNLIPRETVTSGCPLTLYGSSCLVSEATHTFAMSIISIDDSDGFQRSCTITISNAYIPPNYDYLSASTTFLDGFVKQQVSGQPDVFAGIISVNSVIDLGNNQYRMVLSLLPIDTIVLGSAFVTRGCDKTFNTCRGLYNNVIHFAGKSWLPAIENAT